MRTRRAARLLIINNTNDVLLFRFTHCDDALAGRSYWATPGGGLEGHETFEQAAIRELYEETGITRDFIGNSIGSSTFEMLLPSGESVQAEERFFVVKITNTEISKEGWSQNEKNVIDRHHWWTETELKNTKETVYPLNILEMISVLN
ncbi:NUDIX domain-containing protein [Enterobacter sp. D2]|uniref:NUDIX hydrolase n=1 Tax=Enterobacteriaceae TaxID=543 RepID=UPI00107F5E50|nr:MULTISPECIES: NUDIX domain-containing protein [Enterobacteriaceae]EFE3787448.1 NUDIX domain-containing protein [Escherichia coli]ELX1851227.1 NUDIX domain-containing protein [Escherichia coli]MDZ5729531.1 NUDIX domain-containing protein [Enterobacter sp. D2]TGH88551.1 NUDIX domain-containing protein [Escherichia coli]HAW8038925.1 NUDIX domain-containing protein [Escherichia coli]